MFHALARRVSLLFALMVAPATIATSEVHAGVVEAAEEVLARGQAETPLPIGAPVAGEFEIGTTEIDYIYEATEPGVLTVAVRLETDDENDLYIVVMPAPADGVAPNIEELFLDGMMGWPAGVSVADDDLDGDMGAEQVAATVPGPGRFLVRLGAYGTGAYDMVATFTPFPVVAKAVVTIEPETIDVGASRIRDIEPRQSHVYELHAPMAGMLSIVTRGAGDIALSVASTADGSDQVRPIAMADADQAGSGANESIVLDVVRDQFVSIRVSGQDSSRYVITTQLTPVADELAKLFDQAKEGPPHPMVGEQLADLTFHTLDGDPVRLRGFDERVVVLDVWASWCPPCARALPMMQRLADWVKKEDLPVAVLAINSEEDRRVVRSFLERYQLTLPVVLDPEGVADQAFDVTAIPTTIIAVDGVIRFGHVGLMADHEQRLRQAVERALGELEI